MKKRSASQLIIQKNVDRLFAAVPRYNVHLNDFVSVTENET